MKRERFEIEQHIHICGVGLLTTYGKAYLGMLQNARRMSVQKANVHYLSPSQISMEKDSIVIESSPPTDAA